MISKDLPFYQNQIDSVQDANKRYNEELHKYYENLQDGGWEKNGFQ